MHKRIIYIGPDWINFCIAFAFICIGFGLFIGFPGQYFLQEKGWIWVDIVESILAGFVLILMCATSFSNPGIIPKVDPESLGEKNIAYLIADLRQHISSEDVEDEMDQVIRNLDSSLSEQLSPLEEKIRNALFQIIVINGREFNLRFCTTCRIFRPLRTSHCAICDQCVEEFDHHCPFLSNCIGKSNIISFFLFLIFAFILLVFTITMLIYQLALEFMLISVFLLFYSIVMLIPTTILLVFHSFLMFRGKTTHEYLK
jgi:hypothetical protein